MSPASVPERLARILCLLLPSRYRQDIYGDLLEEARARARAGWGRTALRGWMLLQLARSIPLLNLTIMERAMEGMNRPARGGVVYGAVVWLAIGGLLWLAPQPVGTLVLVGWIAVSLFAAGVATLYRTRFVFMGTGMLLGALEAVVVGALVTAGVVSAPPLEPWLGAVCVASILVWVALMWTEKRRAPEEYQTWKTVAEEASLVDIVFLRHIPHMR